ncbi:MAG: 50S ribosomal protein L17 [Gemmataceae bacterium]
MRHLKAGRKLGRNASHRLALMRNLTMALIEHERIITTVEKAKELRPFVEKIITMAKKGTLHSRRLVLSRLGPAAKTNFLDEKGKPTDESVLKKLFKEIGPRFAARPGGYTRVIKRHERRLGDAGRTAFIELLKEGETKVRAKPSAPAPRVTEPTPSTPSAETPPPSMPESSAQPQTPPPESSAQPQTPPPESSAQPQTPPPVSPLEPQPPANP